MSSDSSSQSVQRARGLGSGLATLLGESGRVGQANDGINTSSVKTLPISSLHAGKLQPRTEFDEGEIDSLAQSIKTEGIIQPILVRPNNASESNYEIIAGERRWRAAQLVGLHEVPVIIHLVDDQDALKIALVENLQRQDLNIFEEAEAYQHLMLDYGNSQEDVARALGRSRSHVANSIRMLRLPDQIKAMVTEGKLSARHARVLLGHNNAVELANKVVSDQLNVRQTESLLKAFVNGNSAKFAHRKAKDVNLRDLETTVSNRLGLEVTISEQKQGGSVKIRYKSLEQLDKLLKKLS